MPMKIILNSEGDSVELTDQEVNLARFNQAQIKNSLGYEVDITSLTAISKSIVSQRFFTVPPADYFPVRVGDGAWSTEILTYREFSTAGDFESGILNTGSSNSRLADADAAVDSITVPVINWGKQITYSIMDLMHAQKIQRWDLVTAKEKSRKKNWDLGIQRIAFLGANDNPNVLGLLTQPDVNSNTTVIPKFIKDMTDVEFQALLADILGAYRTNAQFTTMPTHFIIPEVDYNGLASASDESFPLKSKLERLEEAFKRITMNPNFKIMPLAYAAQELNSQITGLDKNRYILLNYDEDTIRMDIPVDYTNTLQNTLNGFQYTNVGYGQFTGCKAYRPREILYFDWSE